MKVRRFLFDIDGGWGKCFVDVLSQLRVTVGFGFQPNASASSWGRAEVKQRRPMFRLRLAKCGVKILEPIHCHRTSLFNLGSVLSDAEPLGLDPIFIRLVLGLLWRWR
jgi:hypothetical protein